MLPRLDAKTLKLVICFLLGAGVWMVPAPEGVAPNGIHLFAIFLATIAAVVSDAMPMGAMTLLALTVAVATKTLTFAEAFAGYTNEIVWLILAAFFIAQGFMRTGLGLRIAYRLVALLGKRTLGLAYGLALADLVLAPVIPSVTARVGGVIFPIAESLAHAFDSKPELGTSRKLGAYLVMTLFQASAITSAMFLTAMAANPLAAKAALHAGVEITWSGWALAALVPGLCSMLVMPWLVFRLYPPEIKHTPDAVTYARRKLVELGPMKSQEKGMLGCFVLLLVLWTFGAQLGVSTATAALLGVAFLLIQRILVWDDLLKLHNAWDTFIWFGALIALSESLSTYGLASWFGQLAAACCTSVPWLVGITAIFLVYYYVHYVFASSTAHVSALYLPFVLATIQLGAPAYITCLVFCFASSLFGGLTHYASGPAPMLFGAGYVSLRDWWRVGLIMSIVNLLIWGSVGAVWWPLIGL